MSDTNQQADTETHDAAANEASPTDAAAPTAPTTPVPTDAEALPPKVPPQRGVRRIRGGRVALAAAGVALAALLALGYGLSPPAQAERSPGEVQIDLRKTSGELTSPPALSLPADLTYAQATRDPEPVTPPKLPGYAALMRPGTPPAATSTTSPPDDYTSDPASAEVLAKLREQNDLMRGRLAEYEKNLNDELADARRRKETRQAAVDASIGFASIKPEPPKDAAPLTAAGASRSDPNGVGDPLNPLVVAPNGGAAVNPNEVQPPDTRSNLQTEKIAFLNAAESGLGTYLRTGPTGPVRPQFELSAGAVIPGFTVNGINTDLPGKVVGRVSSDVYDSATGRYVLIPQGSVAVGSYSSLVSNGQNRVLVAWEMLTFPDGRSVELLRQPGADAAGYAGLADRVDYHFDKLLLAGGVSAAVAVGGQLAEGDQSGFGQTQDVQEQLRRLAFGNASDTASRVANKIIDRQLDVQPTITVRPGWRFNILLTRNLVLEPYVDSRK